MLKSLKINNIAVIENSEPIFSLGLNVLTGETGAGKSIIVDSINAILGERTSKSLIRTGSDKATVIAVFEDVSEYCKSVFDEYDIDDDDGVYIFQRTMTVLGKNTCKINGIPVNTATLKKIGACLINIHGQHDNQLLLDAANHCMFLDAFSENDDILCDYRDSFNRFNTVRRELNRCIEYEKEKADRIEILKYQIDEIEQSGISVGEIEELKQKLKVCENSERINSAVSKVSSVLSSDDNSVSELLNLALSALSKVAPIYSELTPALDKLTSAIYDIEFVKSELENISDNLNFDANELENLQNRFDFLSELTRKYGGTEEKVIEFMNDAKSELDSIELNSSNKLKFETELLSLQKELIEKAEKLSANRKKASDKLSHEVCDILNFLDMQDVCFEVQITQGNYTSHGTDRVEFLISANKGQKLMPLSRVASGGELSRIMLAIKSVLADKDNVDTLIFDEIDTGISGRAARKIAIQLKRVSKLRQGICITHLAQIAAIADNHMLIEKTTSGDKTYTSVSTLSGDSRISEVARIMSGSEITENLYKTAKELIEVESAEE